MAAHAIGVVDCVLRNQLTADRGTMTELFGSEGQRLLVAKRAAPSSRSFLSLWRESLSGRACAANVVMPHNDRWLCAGQDFQPGVHGHVRSVAEVARESIHNLALVRHRARGKARIRRLALRTGPPEQEILLASDVWARPACLVSRAQEDAIGGIAQAQTQCKPLCAALPAA